MKEYDLFIPLFYNDGKRVESRKFKALRDRLPEHFDGLTIFPQPNVGFRKIGKRTYRDQIVIYRVIAAESRSTRRFLSELKKDLEQEFKQEEVLIIERDVEII
jgi:hypothetical protein